MQGKTCDWQIHDILDCNQSCFDFSSFLDLKFYLSNLVLMKADWARLQQGNGAEVSGQ